MESITELVLNIGPNRLYTSLGDANFFLPLRRMKVSTVLNQLSNKHLKFSAYLLSTLIEVCLDGINQLAETSSILAVMEN